MYNVKRTTYPAENLEETILWDFEGVFKMPVPKGYDNVLKITYGDYMKYPPLKDQVGHHYNKGFSLEQGYKEYMKEHKI